MSCYRLVQEIAVDNRPRKRPKVVPQLRVRRGFGDTSSSSSSSTSYYGGFEMKLEARDVV